MSNQSEFSFSTLLAASGHDMKNILGTVLESLEWLREDVKELTDQQTSEFHKSIQLISHVNSELMQLLCMYKFENKQYSPQISQHVLEDFLEMQAAFLSPLLKEGLEVTVDCDDEEMVWFFDEVMVSSAVRNAAMNALKFAKSNIK